MPLKGYKHTEEARNKIRLANKGKNIGKNNPNYGKKPTEKTRNKLRLAKKGEKHPMYGKKHTEESIKKMRLTKLGEKNYMYGKRLSEETREKIRLTKLGEKNYNWKGDKVGYHGLHKRLKKILIKPNECQQCGLVKKLDLANISGEYKVDRADWQWLCRSCHWISDGIISNLKQYGVKKE